MWFDVTFKDKTTNNLFAKAFDKLWFDVTFKDKTTGSRRLHLIWQLWFDVTFKDKTTKYGTFVFLAPLWFDVTFKDKTTAMLCVCEADSRICYLVLENKMPSFNNYKSRIIVKTGTDS